MPMQTQAERDAFIRLNRTASVLALAAKHSATNDSAALCFADAETLARTGTEHSRAMAVHRALNSLRHSVGVMHPDYWEAWEAVRLVDAAFERWMVEG